MTKVESDKRVGDYHNALRDGPLTIEQIANALSLSTTRVQRSLMILCDMGSVIEGKNGLFHLHSKWSKP